MIFDTNAGSYSTISLESVQESPYEVGIGGALMHVYENELNWNAIMKSVGISEMKYYQNTGCDLFVHEAGAFSGFIEKAKAFFKKVIEKIKQIFKTFMAKINSFTMSDKDFVKKYRTDITKKNVEDLEFKGRDKWRKPLDKGTLDYDIYSDCEKRFNVWNGLDKDNYRNLSLERTADQQEDVLDKIRYRFLNGNDNGKYDDSEFREELKERYEGDDPEAFYVTNEDKINAINIITNNADAIKTAKREMDNSEKGINKVIKAMEKLQNDIAKSAPTDEDKTKTVRNLSNTIEEARCVANCNTIAYGAYLGALKDQNRQAKALCVKILGYNKKESYYSESSIDDLFGSVQLV